MSFSLQLEDGDLVLSGTSFGTVVGAAKLQQDLICAILTPLGYEELHPTFGSTLIENLLEPGAEEILGSTNFQHAATLISAELQRICRNYQAQQVARNQSDATRFGKTTLTPNEILVAVKGIQFTQIEDTLQARLELEIGNEVITVSVPIPETTE